MFGEKEQRIVDLEAKIEVQQALLEDHARRDQAIGLYIPIAVALKDQVEIALDDPGVRDTAMEQANKTVFGRLLQAGIDEMAKSFEEDVREEAQRQVDEELVAQESMIREKAKTTYLESSDLAAYREGARITQGDRLYGEVKEEAHQEVDREIAAEEPVRKEKARKDYEGSYGFNDLKERQESKAKQKTIEEVLKEVEGEEYQKALKDRADKHLAEEESKKRVNMLREKAHEHRKLLFSDLEKDDMLTITLGTFAYNDANEYPYNNQRTVVAQRTVKVSVVDPQTGACLVIGDSLCDSTDPYAKKSGFEGGTLLNIGTPSRKHGSQEEIRLELIEGCVMGYDLDDPNEKVIDDECKVAQVTISGHGVHTDLFVQAPNTDFDPAAKH